LNKVPFVDTDAPLCWVHMKGNG